PSDAALAGARAGELHERTALGPGGIEPAGRRHAGGFALRHEEVVRIARFRAPRSCAPVARCGCPDGRSRIPHAWPQERRADRIPRRHAADAVAAAASLGLHPVVSALIVLMPKKAIGFVDVRKIGLTLPDVEVSTAYGSPALKVHGALFACIAINKA